MKQYPTLVGLLRPNQILGYMSARWLVSHADKDRRSGRTIVLAAAHLTEAIVNRSSKVWDHAGNWKTVADPYLDHLIRTLNLSVPQVKQDGVLRNVQHNNGHDPRVVLPREGEMELLALRESVRTVARLGYSAKGIGDLVQKFYHEDVVDEVHDL